MKQVFWGDGLNTLRGSAGAGQPAVGLFELNENKRNGGDAWLAAVLDECRAGALSWENYNFMHGYPTLLAGVCRHSVVVPQVWETPKQFETI